MNDQCPRCLSSSFPRVPSPDPALVAHACEFCVGAKVRHKLFSRPHVLVGLKWPQQHKDR